MTEVDAEDGFIASRRAFLASNPGTELQLSDYNAFRANTQRLVWRYYPYSMAMRMMLKPLDLSLTRCPGDRPADRCSDASRPSWQRGRLT